MILCIPDVLSADEVSTAKKILLNAQWVDGRVTAGYQSALAKDNMQIPEDHEAAKEVGSMILRALGKNQMFLSSALPLRIFPPLFNRYSQKQSFGTHVDNAIRQIAGTPLKIRTDLSATLFFAGPEEYDGGELVIEDTYGVQKIKLTSGSMVLYPATSLHHVTPVTRGERLCSFFWIQSMVREDGKRTLLFDLDLANQRVGRDFGNTPSGGKVAVQLTGIYNNLLRQWAEV